MADFTIDIDLSCDCGNALQGTQYKGGELIIMPCEKCAQKNYDEGYDEGYEEGRKEDSDEG